MPVTPTAVPEVFRVSATQITDDLNRTDVICFVRAKAGKLEVNYSHHQVSSRTMPTGVWSVAMAHRVTLSPETSGMVRLLVYQEFLKEIFGELRVLPGRSGDSIENIDW